MHFFCLNKLKVEHYVRKRSLETRLDFLSCSTYAKLVMNIKFAELVLILFPGKVEDCVLRYLFRFSAVPSFLGCELTN